MVENNMSPVMWMTLLSSGIFCGAAIYISLVEHPVRLGLMGEQVVPLFVRSYKRAAVMQALLALIASVGGYLLWFKNSDPLSLVGSGLFAFIIIYTLAFMMPLNRKLLAVPQPKFIEARPWLVLWGCHHGLRSLLSLIGFVCFLSL